MEVELHEQYKDHKHVEVEAELHEPHIELHEQHEDHRLTELHEQHKDLMWRLNCMKNTRSMGILRGRLSCINNTRTIGGG